MDAAGPPNDSVSVCDVKWIVRSDWAACVSPYTVNLRDDSYQFAVRSAAPKGQFDTPVFATVEFTVCAKARTI